MAIAGRRTIQEEAVNELSEDALFYLGEARALASAILEVLERGSGAVSVHSKAAGFRYTRPELVGRGELIDAIERRRSLLAKGQIIEREAEAL